MIRRLASTTAALSLAAAALASPTSGSVRAGATGTSTTSASTGARVTNGCLASVPEPGSKTPVEICYTIFEPPGASAKHPVPLVMHSHGWGGSRTSDPNGFAAWMRSGYGVLSFDQRGFGASGGMAHVEAPRYEGHDVRKLVHLVSTLAWVQQDGPGDPRLGAIGGSYGGGYQFLGAFTELQHRGVPVFDALAPEITWWDLNRSLAPSKVVRTAWAAALSAAAVPSNALEPKVYQALAVGAATGRWPDGSVPGSPNMEAYFRKNAPHFHVSLGRKLDIPMLFGQGTTDSLFPLQQGLSNFQHAITKRSRRHSIFVGYNGGHVLPAVLPQGVNVTSDPCSKQLGGGDFEHLSIRFFDHALKQHATRLTGYGRYHLATPDSRCITVGSVRADATRPVGTVATTETGGAPLAYAVAQGPITVAGTPYLTGSMTALGAVNRAFYGLGVGTSPADAHLVQNKVLPVNELQPVVGQPRHVDLPSVSLHVPQGQTLYVIASPVSDTFVGMGSRTPGAIVLENTVAHLPVVQR